MPNYIKAKNQKGKKLAQIFSKVLIFQHLFYLVVAIFTLLELPIDLYKPINSNQTRHGKLPSALLREGGDEVECITVQVEVGQQSMVFVCGYGPQLCASPARKELFWDYLEREVQEVAREEKMIVIQMDANSLLGGNFIRGDPNKQTNGNGKLF